ncbi:hypothetical protein BGZ49_001436 [Haplosporangium sp. Z 27]|nr:hypothetical protein BGZ49_001436 [Haplosporangium sp. Z 27]
MDGNSFSDQARYDHQIFDDSNSTTPLDTNRYKRQLDVKDLADIPKRVLHMGSMFATGRILAELPENKKYQLFLRKSMTLTTPILIKASDFIIEKLGGLGRFIGLNLRVGDGVFMKPAEVNVDIVFQRLVSVTGITPKPGYEIVSDSAGQR